MANLVGYNIGAWRRARNLTQALLAVRAGIPQAAVSNIEAGRRDVSLRTLYRLASALGLRPGELLDLEPPRTALTRHELDAVARSVVTGRGVLPPAHRRLADACAAAMRPTLEACSVPGMRRGRRLGRNALPAAVQRYGREQVDMILERVDRLAGSEAR